VTPPVTQADIARSLGVTAQAVSQWVNGKVPPALEHAAAIERLHGIPMLGWTQPAEAEQATEAEQPVSGAAA
jgi:transcriptional regulator with XRE-family HTH domain